MIAMFFWMNDMFSGARRGVFDIWGTMNSLDWTW